MELIRGYVSDRKLPFVKGMIVTLPKGTIVKKIGGDLYELKRKQTIKVHSINNGMSIPVGAYHHKSGRVSLHYTSRHDIDLVKKLYGTDVLEDLWPMMVWSDQENYNTLFLPIEPPELVWPGTGGYWRYVDINQLL